MLAKKGFDPERADHDLQLLSRSKPTFEPLEPLAETDLEGRLQHEHDMIILTAIEESKQLVWLYQGYRTGNIVLFRPSRILRTT